MRILNKLLINNHSYPKKSQETFHLPCYTLKKLFPFIDAGFQEDPISAACVKSSPDKHSLFFKNSHNKLHTGPVIATHGFYLKSLEENTHPNSLHLPRLNFQINRSMLAMQKLVTFHHAVSILLNNH